MSGPTLARIAARTVALAIAVAGAIDPAITSRRTTRPTVVVVAEDSARDAGLVRRVSAALDRRFAVAHASIGADAAVVVGDRVPVEAELPSPAFVVAPDGPRVTIERFDLPRTAPINAHAAATVRLRVNGARGRTLDVSLRSDAATVDHATRTIARDSETVVVPLDFVPSVAGVAHLRATAALSGVGGEDAADASIEVRDRRFAVLFYEPRPSWMSTFVRRAIEADPRFVVASRTVTSRNVSTDAGAPPARLDDPASLAPFDVVVAGAPDALTDAELSALETSMRRRGASVVLLIDQRAPGGAAASYDRLTGATRWEQATLKQLLKYHSFGSDSSTVGAMAVAWPARLPPGAIPLAGDSTKPVVWSTAVGAGRLVVSGALDSWRFRDPSESSFDRFWRDVIADAAATAPPPLGVAIDRAVVAPGSIVGVDATLRDLVLRPSSNAAPLGASAEATLASADSAATTTSIRLWPSDVGRFRGELRAPRRPGVYRVAVRAGRDQGDAAFVVASAGSARSASEGATSSPALVAAWAAVHGGSVLSAADVDRLPSRLAAAIHPQPRLETWHPMRSAWWIVPFTLALSLEWWLRRRSGLR